MATDCLDDDGYTQAEATRANAVSTAANIRRVAAIAIAIDNADQLLQNMSDQRQLASRALSISEQQQAHIQDNFWPKELAFLGEFGTPEDIEAAETLGRRYAGRLVSTVANEFAKLIRREDCNASRYCTSARRKGLQDLMLARAQALANARVLGREIAFTEIQARNDRNFDRRMQAVALGRGLIGQAQSLFEKAGAGLASVGGEYASRLNGALEFFGSARRDPGPPVITQDMIIRPSGSQSRMPYTPNQSVDMYGIDPNTSGIGLNSPLSSFGSADANTLSTSQVDGGVQGLGATNPTSVWRDLQHEAWNEADVGNRNLARVGSHTYNFRDSRGDSHSLTINMSDFKLQFVDDKNPGDS